MWLLLCVSNIECWKDVVCVKIFPLSIVTLSLLTARNPPRLISRLIFVWMCSIDSSPHLKLSNNLCGEGIRLHGFKQYYYWFSKQFCLLLIDLDISINNLYACYLWTRYCYILHWARLNLVKMIYCIYQSFVSSSISHSRWECIWLENELNHTFSGKLFDDVESLEDIWPKIGGKTDSLVSSHGQKGPDLIHNFNNWIDRLRMC